MSLSTQQNQPSTSTTPIDLQSLHQSLPQTQKIFLSFATHTFESGEWKKNPAKYESIKIIEIKNSPTTLDASKLISNFSFRSSVESLQNFTTLILKIDEKLNELHAEKPKTHEFNVKRNFLISYESNKIKNEKIIYWKNGKEGKYLTINLMKEYSAEMTDFVRNFLIDNVNMNLNNSIFKNSDLINLNDSNNLNLLMKAVEGEQTAIVQELLNLPFDIDQKSCDGKTAADIAWENENFKILLQLLEANSIYPKKFNTGNLEMDEASIRIKKIFNISRNLHEAIAANDLMKIKEIIDENLNVRYFYNSSNVSAATAAIKANKIEIYKKLLENECSIGPEENFNQIMNQVYELNDSYEPLRKRLKSDLLTAHDGASQPLPEKHLLMLCANSQTSYDDQHVKHRLKQIKEAYKNLNEIPIAKQILQLISMHSNFKIYFDFNRSSVEFMNPFNGNSYMRGICENVEIKKFYLYIAAKELLVNDGTAFGTLAHELCHFAINLTFCNDARPYAIDDQENKVKFNAIIDKCKVIPKKVLKRIEQIKRFQYKISFCENLLHKSPDELNEVRKNNEIKICKNEEIIFENNEIISIIEEQIAGIKEHNLKLMSYIEDIKKTGDSYTDNKSFERIIKLYQKRIEMNERTLMININKIKKRQQKNINKMNQIRQYNVELQLCNSNNQASIKEYQNKISKLEGEMKGVKGRNDYEVIVSLVFTNYDEVEWPAELIVRVPHMIAHYQNDSNRLDELKVTFKDLFDYYNDVVVTQMSKTLQMLEKLFKNSYELEFSDLNDAYKAKIHHSNVNFQGTEVKFNEIIENKNSKVFQQLSASQIRGIIIENNSLIIGWVQGMKTKFYIERDFIDFDTKKKKDQNFNQISSIAVATKMILLSDHAGAGKTTTFMHLTVKLKDKFPNFWISYIDLKRHLKIYEKFERNFQVLKVLKEILEFEDAIDDEIFTKLFNSDRVILLYDGVDEISPKFKDFFIKFIESVKNSSNNQQWIATRPQHMQELKEKFNQKAYKLLPYDNKQKIELIKNVLKKLKVESVEMADIFDITVILNQRYIDSPLMIQMITELYVNDKIIIENFNWFSLYDRMIEMKKNVVGEKEKIVIDDVDNRKSKLTIWQIHQIYALILLYKDGFYDRLNNGKKIDINEFELFMRWKKEKSKWTPEAISRYGFLIIDHWDTDDEFPDFVHRTFAEFFAAQFLIQDLYELDENDSEMTKNDIDLRLQLLVSKQHSYKVDDERNDKFTIFIKSFIETHESKKMHKRFFKLIKSYQMQKLLIDDEFNFIQLLTIDERFLKEFRFKYDKKITIFQFSIQKSDIFSIWHIIDTYKSSLGADWINHTGYSLKENFSILINEDIDEILKQESIDHEDLDIIKYVYLKYFELLNSINQLDIPQDELLKFFGNNFDEFCRLTFKGSFLTQKLMQFLQINFNDCKMKFIEMIIKKNDYNVIYAVDRSSNDVNDAKQFIHKLEEFLQTDEKICIDDIKYFIIKLILRLCGMKSIIDSYEEEKFTQSQIQHVFINYSEEIIEYIESDYFDITIQDFLIFFKEIFNVQSETSFLKKFLEMDSDDEDEDEWLKNQTVLSYLDIKMKKRNK